MSPRTSSPARPRTRARGLHRFTRPCIEVRAYWRMKAGVGLAPTLRGRLDDIDAALDIAWTQCAGDFGRARRVVDELFTDAGGKLPGDTLHERWLQALWWDECRRPAKTREIPPHRRAVYRKAIQENAQAAARSRAHSRRAG